MFRNSKQAFMQDNLALCLSQNAIEKNFDKELPNEYKSFLYMPFMHSESKDIHKVALKLFKGLKSFEHEVKHKEIIDKFGRYPHRNNVLGRSSTKEELEFLSTHEYLN